MNENESKLTATPDSVRTQVSAERDLRERLQMQIELAGERYGRCPATGAEMERWEADGFAARFTELVKGDPNKGIEPDPEIAELFEQCDFRTAKDKIRAKLFPAK